MSLHDPHHIEKLLLEHYGLSGEAAALPGELDLNYLFTDTGGRRYCFKVANPAEVQANLDLQHAAMEHLGNAHTGLQVPELIAGRSGETILRFKDSDGTIRLCRLLTWVEGRVFALVSPQSADLLFKFGDLCGKLSAGFAGFDHPAAHRFLKWDPQQLQWIGSHLDGFPAGRREMVERLFAMCTRQLAPISGQLRKSVGYNDANDYNVLVSGDPADPVIPGVIDFGDVVHSYTVCDLAIGLAYALMHKQDPIQAAAAVIRGYHSRFPITEVEAAAVFPLTVARLLISVTCSLINRKGHPENDYLQISEAPAWSLLERLDKVSPEYAEYACRGACGYEPCGQRQLFESRRSLVQVTMPVEIPSETPWLDLSVGSTDLGTMADIQRAERLYETVWRQVFTHGNGYALGRYGEARAIYSTDAYGKHGNEGPSWRTVHIGVDFFCMPESPVYAVADGVVHAIRNNAAERDYGPTVILRHDVSSELSFYTLYGHLTWESVKELTPGKIVRSGEQLAAVGDFAENGNWPPHLHFQVMLDLFGSEGDFPGVCCPEDWPVWRSICPDPWQFLTGEACPMLPRFGKQEIVDYRKKHLGKNLSISYRDPIIMLRGDRQYMLDDMGRRYLDTVNNVAHVGHEHPRVVRAGQRQMAVLNTNTRYLHENLVRFTEGLLATVPRPLDVVFMVNSGSEANELAIRLARNWTGQRDMIVSQVGYHGNTNACVEVSSYKFDGPGGQGAAPHIHVVPMPDTYRGLYRAPDPQAGMKYAAHVGGALARIRQSGRGVSALLFESVISCGGQVELPAGFLAESYRLVRAAGGLCIADEVQTGCGRAGDHYWAFEAHGVVPDILTIGKPIGNGHPIGVVVTTQAVADAFRNGMEFFNTFGGNPVSCAIGREVLDVVREEGLQEHARVTGDYLKAGLRNLMSDFPVIGDVRGSGLFLGFELVDDPQMRTPATARASWLANRMRSKGVLMSTDGPANNVLKIKPPMVFSRENADFLLEAICAVMKDDVMRLE